MTDAPIVPMDYLRGVKVVDIGDLRVARGKARRVRSACPHRQLVYDNDERRVWCEDCETTVDPFDAFARAAEQWSTAHAVLKRRQTAVEEAEKHALVSRAAKVMDKAWRAKKTAPMCPHCNEVILPDDVARGVAVRSKEMAVARRKRAQQEAKQ